MEVKKLIATWNEPSPLDEESGRLFPSPEFSTLITDKSPQEWDSAELTSLADTGGPLASTGDEAGYGLDST